MATTVRVFCLTLSCGRHFASICRYKPPTTAPFPILTHPQSSQPLSSPQRIFVFWVLLQKRCIYLFVDASSKRSSALVRPPRSFSAQSQVFFKSFPAISHVTLWTHPVAYPMPRLCSSIIIIIIINHPSSPWSCAVFRFGVIMMYMIHDFSLFRTNTHTQHSAKDAMLQHNGFGMENL